MNYSAKPLGYIIGVILMTNRRMDFSNIVFAVSVMSIAIVGDSGGQRQRITIARAILKDAPVLLLDEVTASLDSRSEREVHKALSELIERKGRYKELLEKQMEST